MPRKQINIQLDFFHENKSNLFEVKQFDDISLEIDTFMNNIQYNPRGGNCKLYVGISNDMFLQEENILLEENKILVKLDRNIISETGPAYAEIELSDDEGTITSTTFTFNVVKRIGEGSQIPGSIEGFVAKYERLIAEFKSQVNTTINNCNINVDNKLNTVDGLINAKISDLEKRFSNLTASQQQDTEVIDARDGEASLRDRLERDIGKAKEIYVDAEGSYISIDSSSGYLKNIEILGNTIQDKNNLADIRSVGDKVEGQELYEIPIVSCGKNLFNCKLGVGSILFDNGTPSDTNLEDRIRTEDYISICNNKTYTINKKNVSTNVYFYTIKKSFISAINLHSTIKTFTTPDNCSFVKFVFSDTDLTYNYQLEEGTQVTPYESYQEDKLIILSPVQLEKIGNVADRIIEKNGVWGVEKNIITVNLADIDSWAKSSSNNLDFNIFHNITIFSSGFSSRMIMCDKLLVNEGISQYYINGYNQILVHKEPRYSEYLYISVDIENLDKFKKWLKDNNPHIKYITETEPQFIPLPHSQQVKLRTFANKTNISFLCDVDGTLVAQVPKSLGSTVNTHTNQIDNLNKELSRVKKLEESTVSTVETESDFTVVEQTSNGYFEDIKLEGKTLINNVIQKHYRKNINVSGGSPNAIITGYNDYNGRCIIIGRCKGGIKYTIVPKSEYYIREIDRGGKIIKELNWKNSISTHITQSSSEYFVISLRKDSNSTEFTSEKDMDMIILEGDHTQNQPSYFEGLKSVGDGVDEVSVESVSENLFDISLWKTHSKLTGMNQAGSEITWIGDDLHFKALVADSYTNTGVITEGKVLDESIRHLAIQVLPNTTYTVSCDVISDKSTQRLYLSELKDDYSYNALRGGWSSNTLLTFTTKADTKFLTMRVGVLGVGNIAIFKNIQIKRVNTLTSYTLHKSDKKRLLYYNEETQSWEKPVLREWDSIEKHSDGKYYYHQRSGEVVLNGSRGWILNKSAWENNLQFILPYSNVKTAKVICDKFIYLYNIEREESIWVFNNEKFVIHINKSKLETQDVAGFKKWLQANNVTVVYQLAEENVYECTNIDLITYANETNYVVESGAIIPKSTLKVHNNISNVVSLLQKKVSVLESNITNYMITQNRLMLSSRYNTDTVGFKVDVASSRSSFEYDNDLYELILNNILIGKDNYNREYIENLIIFYWMDFVISDEMYSTLFEIIEEQYNPKVIEAPIE